MAAYSMRSGSALQVYLVVLLATMATLTESNEDQNALKAVADANTAFTTSLYNALKDSNPGNLIFSPYSLSTVMAMVRAGARGKTAQAIDSALKYPTDQETLNKGYKVLINSLKSDGDQFTLETANRIYSQKGFEMKKEFVDTLKTYYDAEATQLNFGRSAEAAKTINDFVKTSTHDKIKDLISSSDLDALTRLVLVNAIYFKGLWKNKFDPALTKKAPFHINNNETVDVDMMKLETDLLYGNIEELNAEVVSLPYKGDRLSMLVLLPKDIDGLSHLEEKLKTYPLSSIPGQLRERKVVLRMPKFKLETTINLEEPLKSLGLGEMFDQNKADLSGIPANAHEQLYVSKAVQKAFIEVNEEGSEAAAATGVQITLKSAIYGTPMTINHPFVAAIYDNTTTSVLFFNTFSDPLKEKTKIGAFGKSSESSDANSILPSLITSLMLTAVLLIWSAQGFHVIIRQAL